MRAELLMSGTELEAALKRIAELEMAVAASVKRDEEKEARIARLEKALEQKEDGSSHAVINPLAAVEGEPAAPSTQEPIGSQQIRNVVAQLSQTPANFHQFCAFALSRPADGEDADLRRWGPLLFAVSCVMVSLQVFAAIAVGIGTQGQTCVTNDDCPKKGRYCQGFVGADAYNCRECGTLGPLMGEVNATSGEIYNLPHADYNEITQQDLAPHSPALPLGEQTFGGYNDTAVQDLCDSPSERTIWSKLQGAPATHTKQSATNWCDACVHAETGSVDPLTNVGSAAATIATMSTLDWITAIFAAVIISLATVGDLKDIKLIGIAVTHAGENLGAAWRWAFAFVGGVRRWLFLPSVILAAGILIVAEGGGAKSVCLNSVAILFMLEVDNMMYSFALPERWRTRMEADGRVRLSKAEADAVARMKMVHAVVLAVVSIAFLRLIRAGYGGSAFLLYPAFFWVASLVDMFESTEASESIAKKIVTAARGALAALAATVGYLMIGAAFQ
eukprot:COSAG04_NODE_1944_length_5162_cov_4.060020_3_plen_504_part_00